jgi:transposase-like protein
VAGRVSPVERLRAEIDQLFSSDRDLASILEDVARLSVRLVFQTALEAEVEEFLGRARYQRRGDADRPGSRNGWQPPMTIKTTMGAVELQRPKLRGTDQAFCSRLFGAGVTRTNALESLVISGWVRGLSDRDIEATLAEVLGPEAALSKSTVSRICAAIGAEFAAWRTRELSEVRLDYLFLDASHFKMHPGAPAEPVLAAGGVDVDGKPVFVGLAPAASESTDAWDDFLADLVGRGLGPRCWDQRRRGRADRRVRPGVPALLATAVPGPPRPQCARQGLCPRPAPSEGRLLGHLRRRRGRAW